MDKQQLIEHYKGKIESLRRDFKMEMSLHMFDLMLTLLATYRTFIKQLEGLE